MRLNPGGSGYRSASVRSVRRFAVLEQLQVGIDHLLDQLFEGGAWLPTQGATSFGRIADQQINLGRPEEPLILDDVLVPVQVNMPEGSFYQLLNGVRLAGGNH